MPAHPYNVINLMGLLGTATDRTPFYRYGLRDIINSLKILWRESISPPDLLAVGPYAFLLYAVSIDVYTLPVLLSVLPATLCYYCITL